MKPSSVLKEVRNPKYRQRVEDKKKGKGSYRREDNGWECTEQAKQEIEQEGV